MYSSASLREPPPISGDLCAISARDFERLIGEVFRHQGFTLTGFGDSGHDGGVDLALVKNGKRFLVQCKHWRKPEVGVGVVRELDGVLRAVGADGGYVVTAGQFTREAHEASLQTQVQLIDRDSLAELIEAVRNRSAA